MFRCTGLILLCTLLACAQADTDMDALDGSTSPIMTAMDEPQIAPPPGCGDGKRSDREACDDGNNESGDGCDQACRGVEPGYACPMEGKPCRPIARCGDGIVAPSEACDDGGTKEGDGCSPTCKLELGYKCEGEPSACSATTCGDGVREGSEGCDDGNALPFDGCSALCQTEPNCGKGACSSTCGDGLVLGEDCDDGNRKNGDGCSEDCKVEAGFECSANAKCDANQQECTLNVSAVFRDFTDAHPDFAVGCGTLTTGLVADMLSDSGTPQLAGDGSAGCIQSQDTFSDWYTDGSDRITSVGTITLYPNDAGGYVNRYGPNGEPWHGPEVYNNVVYGGPGGTGCEMCTPTAMGACFDPCTPWNNGQACCAELSQQDYDGNPLFFPVDDNPGGEMRAPAKVPSQYGYDGWPWEDDVFGTSTVHNFYFTTQVVYWFEYQASQNATLDFLGDDDVWVFINGTLAVDLGAPHEPESGSVTLDTAGATRFGLKEGNVYEIRVFHAERKMEGSSFKLTLSGFDNQPSECTPTCGDGIVTAGEECDDGVNDGGYEECAPGCVLEASCGDGIVQEGEDCDDGNRNDGDSCGSSCRNIELI